MIRLNCVKCRKTLEMDDAFAGSVCRCQHCGTIQTVPKRSASSPSATAAPAASASSSAPAKSKQLYQKKAGAPASQSGSELDELASAVAGRNRRSTSPATGSQKNLNPFDRLVVFTQRMLREQPALMIGIGTALAVLLIAIIAALVMAFT